MKKEIKLARLYKKIAELQFEVAVLCKEIDGPSTPNSSESYIDAAQPVNPAHEVSASPSKTKNPFVF